MADGLFGSTEQVFDIMGIGSQLLRRTAGAMVKGPQFRLVHQNLEQGAVVVPGRQGALRRRRSVGLKFTPMIAAAAARALVSAASASSSPEFLLIQPHIGSPTRISKRIGRPERAAADPSGRIGGWRKQPNPLSMCSGANGIYRKVPGGLVAF